MLIRFILLLLFVYFGIKTYQLLSRRLSRRGTPQHSEERMADVQNVSEMVRDPVCGVYIPSDEALTATGRGGTFYFCSEECRRRFLDDQGRR